MGSALEHSLALLCHELTIQIIRSAKALSLAVGFLGICPENKKSDGSFLDIHLMHPIISVIHLHKGKDLRGIGDEYAEATEGERVTPKRYLLVYSNL